MIEEFNQRLAIALIGMTMTGAKSLGEIWGARPRLIFIGNGGSAAIASHMATDFSNKARIPSMALNDLSALTCIANDYGYQDVFSRQLRWQAEAGNVLVAISSSGESQNIVQAIHVAKDIGMKVVTLTGFENDNRVRILGDINFYVPSSDYGIVETAHLGILHALLEQVAK